MKSLKEEFPTTRPLMPSMATLSDNEQGILCTEHLRGLLIIKSSVNKNNVIKIEEHFTN